MPLRALVLSADARVSGLLAQVLAELELGADLCAAADLARQKLAGHVYSALILDCENESEIGALLQEARKLAAGKKLAFVALVGGPGAPATAFRLGADFVLTKPVAVQQAKNTLRTLKLVLEKMPSQAAPEPAGRATAAAAAAGADSALFRDLSVASPAAAPAKPVAPVPAPMPAKPVAPLTAPVDSSADPAGEPGVEAKPVAEVVRPVSMAETKPDKSAAKKTEPPKPLVVVRSSPAVVPQASLGMLESYGEKKSGTSGSVKVLAAVVVLVGAAVVFRDRIPWQALGPLAPYAQSLGLYKPVAAAPVPPAEEPASTAPKPEPGTPELQPAGAPADATENPAVPTGDAAASDAVTVPEEEMEKLLAERIEPVIPADQLPTGPVSPVVLQARISKDGVVTDVKLAQGETQLAPYAMRAVRQWRYHPYVQNDQPVDVQTQVTVTFGPQ